MESPPHTHTHTGSFTRRGAMQKCDGAQFSLHICAHPHLVKNLHTLSSVTLKCTTTHIQYAHIIRRAPFMPTFLFIMKMIQQCQLELTGRYSNSPRLYRDISFSFSRAASVQTFMSLIKAEPTQGGLRLFTADSSRQQYCSLQKNWHVLYFSQENLLLQKK